MNKINEVKPQRANANRHTPRGMKTLEDSIQRDGWIGAITVAADHETFDGSARLEVGAATGFEDAIVVRSDGSKPVIHIREDIPTADDPRAKRLGVAANWVAQLNLDWSPEILAQLAQEDGILDGLFSDQELADLLASLDTQEGAGGDDFDTTPQDGPTRVQPGELWQLGAHRLLCGDTRSSDWLQECGADAIFGDPPFDMTAPEQAEMIDGLAWCPLVFWLGVFPELGDVIKAVQRKMTYDLVWHTVNPHFPGNPMQPISLHKNILLFADTMPSIKHKASNRLDNGERTKVPSIWNILYPAQKEHGKYEKPVKLLEMMLEAYDIGTIGDPYSGVGVSFIAAERTHRKCYGMEIEPRYCDVILRRWEAETGREAVRLDG